jgi:hypothetical protein
MKVTDSEWNGSSIHQNESAPNFFLNVILIYYCHSNIFGLGVYADICKIKVSEFC